MPLVHIAGLLGQAIQQRVCGCHSAGMYQLDSIKFSKPRPKEIKADDGILTQTKKCDAQHLSPAAIEKLQANS
jgi:hypothetical protein